MNKVAAAKHLRAIAEAYSAADKLAADFWQSPDGAETLKLDTLAWHFQNIVKRYTTLADDIEGGLNATRTE